MTTPSTKITLPTGGIKPLETHSYDGKLIDQSTQIQHLASQLSYDKTTAFTHLAEMISNSPTVNMGHKRLALEALSRIIRDMNKSANFDSTNHSKAESLLLFLYDAIEKTYTCACGKVYHLNKNPPKDRRYCDDNHSNFRRHLVRREYLPIVAEQLHDIVASGECPQGRCTRLLQLCIHINDIFKIYCDE